MPKQRLCLAKLSFSCSTALQLGLASESFLLQAWECGLGVPQSCHWKSISLSQKYQYRVTPSVVYIVLQSNHCSLGIHFLLKYSFPCASSHRLPWVHLSSSEVRPRPPPIFQVGFGWAQGGKKCSLYSASEFYLVMGGTALDPVSGACILRTPNHRIKLGLVITSFSKSRSQWTQLHTVSNCGSQ